MTITLPEDLERRLAKEVEAGRVESVEAAVVKAVRAHYPTAEELRRVLDEAEADYRENGGVEWEDIEAKLDRRLADAD